MLLKIVYDENTDGQSLFGVPNGTILCSYRSMGPIHQG